MPVKHRRSWPRRIVIRFPAPPKKLLRNLILLVLLVGILLCALRLTGYLRELSGTMALSDAEDLVIDTVNEAVMAMMASGEYDYNYFVSMEKDADGKIVSLDANMSRINAFASQLLFQVGLLDQETIHISIPVGNLLGSSLLLGKGPAVQLDMIMLTSPRAELRSELESAGINQTKHQILLDVDVYVIILLPGITTYTKVSNEISVAETVIVGSVPQTYTYFSTTEDKIEDYADEYIMNNG